MVGMIDDVYFFWEGENLMNGVVIIGYFVVLKSVFVRFYMEEKQVLSEGEYGFLRLEVYEQECYKELLIG